MNTRIHEVITFMNTKTFERNPEKSATGKVASGYTPGYRDRISGPSPRRRSTRPKFINHLPLHPHRCSYQGGKWNRTPKLDPSIVALLRGKASAVYMLVGQNADNQTQICDRRQEWFAKKLNCSLSTIERAFRNLRELQLIESFKTRIGWMTILLEPPSDPAKMTGRKNSTRLNENSVVSTPEFSSTSANAPVPRAREGVFPETPAPSSPDEPPRPSKPPIPAAEPAKPPAKPRQRWNGRSHSVIRQLTPVQKAAEQVMAALGIGLSLWRTRDAIAHAIRQWSAQNPDQGLEAAVAALVGIRQDFLRAFRAGLLWRDYLVEEQSFFQKDFWQDRNSWGWNLKAQRLAKEARVGVYDPATAPSWEERCVAEERELREQYAMWSGMSEAYRTANPWKGKVYE